VAGAAWANSDGGDSGAAVPLPRDWPDGGGPPGWFRTESRVLREVAARILAIAADGHQAPPGSMWKERGAVRALDLEPGRWATGRSVQHLHAQLREAVTAFHGALVAGLPAVAARLEKSAAEYDQADRDNAQVIDRTATGLDGGPPAGVPAAGGPTADGSTADGSTAGGAVAGGPTADAPSVVGPDGRF
jgi:hypothetical protein